MKQYQSPSLEICFFKVSDVLKDSDPQTPLLPWSLRLNVPNSDKMDIFTK